MYKYVYLNFYLFYLYVCVYVCVRACMCAHAYLNRGTFMEIKGQFAGVGSFFSI